MNSFSVRLFSVMALALLIPAWASAQSSAVPVTPGPRPNLEGQIAKPLRYHPDHGDFIIDNGQEFFNRSLYGGHTAFRVEGGDRPEFLMYLPGRGGNLRLGIEVAGIPKWFKDADDIVTRYRPGELIYTIGDKAFGHGTVTLEVLAYAETEGLAVRISAEDLPKGAKLLWAYGGVNGERGSRDGDIGTERVPIGQYFQFKPEYSKGNVVQFGEEGFTLESTAATIVGIVPNGARQRVGDATDWDDAIRLFALPKEAAASPAQEPVVIGLAPLLNGKPTIISLQKTTTAKARDLDVYSEVAAGKPREANPSALPPAFARADLPGAFGRAQSYFDMLRNRVRIETPDPYLDAAVGALNVAADALWDDDAQAIMHGAIAWRTKLLGWRGPYALDDLGWHDRARENFDTWLPNQNQSPVPRGSPPADANSNLARNEAGLHSNGDLSNSHYDMNLVFIDALLRHILWTGDIDYARSIWPALTRHLAWERRLFRREYGPDKLPLYEAYADIWASDDLYYSGGGTAVASAYNIYANRMAARLAILIGQDPAPYQREADLIGRGMHTYLWLPKAGAFAESKDLLGRQDVHDDYGLWTFYHSIDEAAATPREAWRMGTALEQHLKPIPVEGPSVPSDRPYSVLPETDWMPYTWSVNNVVMDENLHTALALWQGGHSEYAFTVAKGAILASMYMGISPGNVGTLNYLDVYRRESQRDFADSAGTMSRAIIEGLFGVRPDALDRELTVSPGFPRAWRRARLRHPDFTIEFRRDGVSEQWRVAQTEYTFKRLLLRVPAIYSRVVRVTANGTDLPWRLEAAPSGEKVLIINLAVQLTNVVNIRWGGHPELVTDAAVRPFNDPSAARGIDWSAPRPGHYDPIDLVGYFNDCVCSIFKVGKYKSPRSPFVSLALPSQGIGAWAGHMNVLPEIDDVGLRRIALSQNSTISLPNGVPFKTPGTPGTSNIAFTSQWDNYPRSITVPIAGRATHLFLLMAGTTNAMQSHFDNGEVVVTYTDGTSSRLTLRNPDTWWPIDQDYFIDDYQFRDMAPLPPRLNLRTGKLRILDPADFKGRGREVPGGAASVLDMPLDGGKALVSLTVRTLANDVVVGLMAATLQRPPALRGDENGF